MLYLSFFFNTYQRAWIIKWLGFGFGFGFVFILITSYLTTKNQVYPLLLPVDATVVTCPAPEMTKNPRTEENS